MLLSWVLIKKDNFVNKYIVIARYFLCSSFQIGFWKKLKEKNNNFWLPIKVFKNLRCQSFALFMCSKDACCRKSFKDIWKICNLVFGCYFHLKSFSFIKRWKFVQNCSLIWLFLFTIVTFLQTFKISYTSAYII